MMEADYTLAQRDKFVRSAGYRTLSSHE
jgi:hypothetical protein